MNQTQKNYACKRIRDIAFDKRLWRDLTNEERVKLFKRAIQSRAIRIRLKTEVVKRIYKNIGHNGQPQLQLNDVFDGFDALPGELRKHHDEYQEEGKKVEREIVSRFRKRLANLEIRCRATQDEIMLGDADKTMKAISEFGLEEF